MDYDGNDFQNQNLQLVGEDNNRFPQSLQSFALPKFEIDDHLQAHLRFDNLNQTDALLDMQGQDHNWLEDFSDAGHAIDLSSTAAESCTIPRLNNVWSEATLSESVEMLLKSVGEDELNQKFMTKGSEGLVTLAMDDSTDCEIEAIRHNEPSLPPDKCQDDDVSREHDQSSFQDDQAVMNSDLSSLDEELNSCGKDVAEMQNNVENLKSSSVDETKECVVVNEFLKVAPNDDALQNASMISNSSHDDGCLEKMSSKMTPNCFCNNSAQEEHSAAHMDTINAAPGNSMKELLIEHTMENVHTIGMSEISDPRPPDELNMTSHALHSDDKIDQHFDGHVVSDEAYNTVDSSTLDILTEPPVLLNEKKSPNLSEGTGGSMFAKKSDDLLKVTTYQVKVASKDNKKQDEIVTCSEVLPSVACDHNIKRNSSEVMDEDVIKLSHAKNISKNIGQCVEENLLYNGLRSSNSSMKIDCKQLATSKTVEDIQYLKVHMSSKSCDELSSSDTVADLSLSTPLNQKLRMDIDKDGTSACTAEQMNSKNSALVIREISAEDYIKVINVESDARLFPSKHASIKGSPTSVSDMDMKISSSIVSKLAHVSDKGALLVESNEGNTCLETSAAGEECITLSLDAVVSKSNHNYSIVSEVGTSLPIRTCSVVDDSSSENLTSDKAVAGPALADVTLSSTNDSSGHQQLHCEVFSSHNIDVEERLLVGTSSTSPIECSNPLNISLLGTEISSQQLDVLDTAVCDASTNGNGTSTGEICIEERNSSPVSCQITNKRTEADTTPENINDKHNQSQIISDSSNGSFCKKMVSTLPRNEVKPNSLETECGNTSYSGANCDSPTVITSNEQSQAEVEDQGGNKESIVAGPDAAINSDKISFTGHESKEGIISEDDGSFTFEVRAVEDMPQENTTKNWKPFADIQSIEMHQTSTASYPASPTKSKEGVNDREKKKASNRKTRKVGISNVDAKERSQPKQAKGKDRNPSSSSQKSNKSKTNKIQMVATEQSSCSENSNAKSPCSSIQTSKLHDLNTSIPSAALYYQPFTDMQQVQLRAQIFVYGSLIQGVLPDEACMISAFGGTDGGRSLWNGAMHTALERYQSQSPLNNYGTPLLRHSGMATEQMSNSSSTPNQPLTSGRSAGKILPSVLNSSLSSPFWCTYSHGGFSSSIPRGTHLDFNQSVFPSQAREYMSNSTLWLSQTPRPASRLFPSKSMPFSLNPQYSVVPTAGAVQITPIRDSSASRSSNLQSNAPASLLPNQDLGSVSSPLVLPPETQKKSSALVSNKIEPIASKSRKRKKASITQEHPISQSECPISFGLSSDSPSTITPSLIATISRPVFPTHYSAVGGNDTQQNISFLEDTVTRIEQSKLQAASASASAAAAVGQSQDIWGQLAIQRQSGMISVVEEKLASAVVAAAAAASIARAAAEAARVASEAAYQAKMIADEALDSGIAGSSAQNSVTGINTGTDLAKSSSVSMLKDKDKMQRSNSVISAAREAARKRVEVASAAAKRAENLDAIMKAAELTVESISQAGIIIAMGDPLPFSIHELVENGPEVLWKAHVTLGNTVETDNVHPVENINGNPGIYTKQSKSLSSHNVDPKSTGAARMFVNDKQLIQSDQNYEGRDSRSGSQAGPSDIIAKDSSVGSIQDRGIQKGSIVEVVRSEDHTRGAWFSASVLDLKDGKAHVCYKHLREGQGPRKEWIPLKKDGDKAPRIRGAHPITVVKYNGTRKRRREAAGSYVWAIGDKVDAWMHDGWWEGVVIEKSHEDESKLTVHISASSESEAVSAWNLRPSLIWQDGQWSLGTHATERTSHDGHEGDTPCEKRQKLDQIESKKYELDGTCAEDKLKTSCIDEPLKCEVSKPIQLSEKDVSFSIGSNVERENNVKVKRRGLQKEGSRVIFGVPKPGKRRKFMEVSKHYTTDTNDKKIEQSDSVKLSNYLMPQVSNAWRNPSKVDSKGRQVTISKPRGLKSLRAHNIHAKNIIEKDTLSITTALNVGKSGLSSLPNLRSCSDGKSATGNNNSVQSNTYLSVSKKVNIPIVESSLPHVSGNILSRNKSAAVNENTGGRGGKVKNLSIADKSTSSEFQESENSGKFAEVAEPRRSSRQIQPTSRLLEGLQSSLITSKIPSVSHDRGIKNSNKSVSSSRGKNHG